MLYFSWLKKDEAFDPAVHAQGASQEEQILAIKVTHKESGFPHAHVLLTNQIHTPNSFSTPAPEKAVVYYEKQGAFKILFCGFVVKSPVKSGDHCITVTLTAESPHAQAHLFFDQRQLKRLPLFDPLFVDPECVDDLDEILEGYTQLPHWNRRGDFSFADLLEGSKTIDMEGEFDHASLKTRLKKRPLAQVRVHLSAQWVQEHTGLLNLSPTLIDALPEPFITTLTPQQLEKSWFRPGPGPGGGLMHTGYTVAQSRLVPFDPIDAGVSDRYPPVSSGFFVREREGVRVPRSWFVPHLVLGVTYRQKREESVHFTLRSSLQAVLPTKETGTEPLPGQGAEKKLRFRLQDIRRDDETPLWREGQDYAVENAVQHKGHHYTSVQRHRSSRTFEEDRDQWVPSSLDRSALGDGASATYFLTPRGNQSIIHALERAKAHLAMGARVFEVTFETDFDAVDDLDCDTSIRLKDNRFHGGEVIGKVVAYTLTFTHGVARATITMLSCIGNPPVLTPLLEEGSFLETPSRIVVENPAAQRPTEGILDPRSLGGGSILRRLRVINGAADQNALIAGKTFDSLKEAEALIAENPTRIILDLMDLSQGAVLRHSITLQVLRPFVAPCHVLLQETL